MRRDPHPPSIVWFRQDLRLADNPALAAACRAGGKVLPVYILDDDNAGLWKMGGASRVWLYHSLQRLRESLGGNLLVLKGDAATVLPELAARVGAGAVYWNRCYEPWRTARDGRIKHALKDLSIEAQSFNGSLLWEPWEVLKADGTPYKVFTPFFTKGCLAKGDPRAPMEPPSFRSRDEMFLRLEGEMSLEDLGLLPSIPWDRGMMAGWDVGEKGAAQALRAFLDAGLKGYKEGRDFMARSHVSRLSPHLHFGEISPHQVWHAAKARGIAERWDGDLNHFLSELGWREFSYGLLYHSPDLPEKNLQPRFDTFPWSDNQAHLRAWQKGQTGYPIVDAAMRELWQTGYMHNRARMVVGSFLVKHLLIHWRHGEEWFWDCLFDADLANNAVSWQWIAGCGADAAPYFRIFNPVTQGEKFDARGDYVRRFVPELKDMPDKFIHRPWEAPDAVLQQAGVRLGQTYPRPIVDHAAARERALAAFACTGRDVF